MKLSLFFIILICRLALFAQIDTSTRIKSVRETEYVMSKPGKKNIRYKKQGVYKYFFNMNGSLKASSDSLLSDTPNILASIEADPDGYIIQSDESGTINRVERILTDSLEYQIHFPEYNSDGYLVKDSILLKSRIDNTYQNGTVVKRYAYNEKGNKAFELMKSNYVFAIIDFRYYTYEYDSFGNWISKEEFEVNTRINWDTPLDEVDTSSFKMNRAPIRKWTRELEYY